MSDAPTGPVIGQDLPSRTIQSLWIGDRLSRLEVLSIKSFLANGHPYHLYTYGKVDRVPKGVVLKDANAILPEAKVFRANGSLAIFADWFRQEMLHACGGYWADLDMVCLRPLDFEDPIVFGRTDPQRVCNALMRFPQGHPLTRQLADVSRDPNLILESDSPRDRRRKRLRRFLPGRHDAKWGESSGPTGLTRVVKHHGLFELAKPYFYFYPLPFSFWICAFDDTFRDGAAMLEQSYCLHLWNEKIRKATGVKKDGPYREGSLVDQLTRRYNC
ncbi:MAG: hypothetical protein ABL986_01390 [Vicinamibacterales bacterium]